MLRQYYRGSYVLYPRRLYVTDDGRQVLDATTLVDRPAPDPAFLAAHDVRYVLTFTRHDGPISSAIQTLVPAGH